MQKQPVVEIAGIHFDDECCGDLELVVFVNGEQCTARIEIAKPFLDVTDRSEWRQREWEATRTASPAFASAVSAFYRRAENEDAIVNDLHPAVDVQPHVATPVELDPSLWFDAAATHTAYRAATAVVALRVFRTCRDSENPRKAAAAAVKAFRAATHNEYEFVENVLVDLLCNLRHLADARGFALEALPHTTDPGAEIHRAAVELITALRDTATEVWALQVADLLPSETAELMATRKFARAEARAFAHYLGEAIRSEPLRRA